MWLGGSGYRVPRESRRLATRTQVHVRVQGCGSTCLPLVDCRQVVSYHLYYECSASGQL